MFDYKPTLVTALQTISSALPVQYELFMEPETVPRLTYMEQSDTADKEGGNLRYSYKTYRIKLWGKELDILANYSSLLDTKMYSLGFKRINYNELSYNDVLCMIFDYRALVEEKLEA